MAGWSVYPHEEIVPDEVELLASQIEEDGGKVLSIYREPYGNNWQLFALLPLMKVQPTPFQRDLSNQHVDRLQEVIKELDRFLDPIIVIRTHEGEYWTPNGNHRREAMVQLGKGMIAAIVVPDVKVAYQILALNTEKAHNIKEKALEVIRMYRGLLSEDGSIKETDYAFHFEEAYFVTLGLIYERRERFSGSAYVPILRKVDSFLELPLPEAMKEREKRAELLEGVDSLVEPIVQSLRERGFNQPFLKQAVVSKVNPIKRKRIVEIDYYEALNRMMRALKRFDPAKITPEELAAAIAEGEF
ncbi:MAG: ParB/RepB/Spo0J family partition protein [Armatimonadetes bacterium]|nr:ParB/RepB/Spo0J family partition protein [Armatimonadota bacterium]MDW8029962.1 ParB N-terminal domain-containing protein [Armatimonadota bacterium]